MTIMIYDSDKYNTINLDVFNIDTSTIGRRSISSFFSSFLQIILTFLLPIAIVASSRVIAYIENYYLE